MLRCYIYPYILYDLPYAQIQKLTGTSSNDLHGPKLLLMLILPILLVLLRPGTLRTKLHQSPDFTVIKPSSISEIVCNAVHELRGVLSDCTLGLSVGLSFSRSSVFDVEDARHEVGFAAGGAGVGVRLLEADEGGEEEDADLGESQCRLVCFEVLSWWREAARSSPKGSGLRRS